MLGGLEFAAFREHPKPSPKKGPGIPPQPAQCLKTFFFPKRGLLRISQFRLSVIKLFFPRKGALFRISQFRRSLNKASQFFAKKAKMLLVSSVHRC